MSCVWLACCILPAKNFNFEYYTQTVQPNSFIPAMLIGTIDFYHFILLSLTLTLDGGHKIDAKQNLLCNEDDCEEVL